MQISSKVRKYLKIGRDGRQYWTKDQNFLCNEWADDYETSGCYKTSCVHLKKLFQKNQLFFSDAGQKQALQF